MSTTILHILSWIILAAQVSVLVLYIQNKVNKKSMLFGLALTSPVIQAFIQYLIYTQ